MHASRASPSPFPSLPSPARARPPSLLFARLGLHAPQIDGFGGVGSKRAYDTMAMGQGVFAGGMSNAKKPFTGAGMGAGFGPYGMGAYGMAGMNPMAAGMGAYGMGGMGMGMGGMGMVRT